MYIVNKTHSYARTRLQYLHTNAREQIHKQHTGHSTQAMDSMRIKKKLQITTKRTRNGLRVDSSID